MPESEIQEALSLLKKIEQNQLKALELQAEHLATVKAQMQRAEVKMHESIALQKTAIARQAKALAVVLPIALVALLYAGYLLFRGA